MSDYEMPPDDQSGLIAIGLRTAYRAGFDAALEAAACHVERIGDYASDARAAEIRAIPLPEPAPCS